MASANEQRIKEADEKRYNALKEIESDAFIGYETLDAATAAYKCNSQAEVLARLLNRENVFVSGPAGSGKSFVLNRFTTIIDAQFNGKFGVALTASTGIAATIIGGQTIHSWAGLGIDTEPFDPKKVSPMMKNKIKPMRETDVLIIDEISMLPAYLFEKLDAVLKWARNTDKPFGGIQLVLTGDFLQLPPVSKRGENVDTGFAIQTQAWKDANIRYTYMDKTHRASDIKLKYLLTKIANGNAKKDPKVMALLESRMGSRSELCDSKKTYATLFTVNKNVDEYNQSELNKNPQPLIVSTVELEGAKKDTDKIIKQNGILERIEFKVGATVMLTSNIRLPNGDFLANGSIGVITGMISKTPLVRFNDGSVQMISKTDYPLMKKIPATDGSDKLIEFPVARVRQLPLKLGYAITVHKSQGQSFDGVVTDLSKIFAPGLGYVALSRVKTLDDLVITGWNNKALELDPLSKKISVFVKRRALESRQDFIDNNHEYIGLLDNNLSRVVMWQEDESALLNGAKRNWKF